MSSPLGPPMGRGSMSPGARAVRQGLDIDGSAQVSRALIGRVWRRFAHPYRWRLAGFLAVIVVAAGLAVLPAILFGRLVDDGILAENLTVVWILAGAAVAVALLTAISSLTQRWLSAWIGEHLILDLRTALFDHVQRMPVAFFTRTQTGALISRLNNDVVGAQQAVTGTFGSVAANVIQVIVVVGVMLRSQPLLTLLVLVVLPVFILPARRVGRTLQEITRESMGLNAAMNQRMTERFNVAGARLVTLFGRHDEEAEAFDADARQVARIGVRSALVGRVFFAILGMVGAVGVAVVYGVGGRLAITSPGFSAGDVVTFAALVTQAYQPMAQLTNARVEVMQALVAFERVFEILDLDHPISDAPDAVALPAPRGAVTFDHVTFAYPEPDARTLAALAAAEVADVGPPGAPVLTDITFSAPPGSTVALVGPSGAGKTTICNLVPRLYDATDGAVRLDGTDVREVRLDDLRSAIGVVSQDPHLFHESVLDNLRYARPDASDEDIVAACRAAQIHHVIEALPEGYDTVVGERGHRLSGGEQQRLAIARLLLKDPAVVILDEATAHLDSANESAVQAALSTALRGRTSLVIAHRLSTIVAADLILVIQDGRIVQRGTHAELVRAEGLYADLARTQLGHPTAG